MSLRLFVVAVLASATTVLSFSPAHSFGNTATQRISRHESVSRWRSVPLSPPGASALSMLSGGPSKKSIFSSHSSAILSRIYQSKVKANLIKINQWMKLNCWSKMRRALVSLVLVTTLWCSAARVNTPPAYASSTASAAVPPQERVVNFVTGRASLDNMVDQFVQKHMFDDDSFDQVESTYRESYQDVAVGNYPNALREATASVLGERGLGNLLAEASETSNWLSAFMGTMQKKFGLSAVAASAVLAVTGLVALPFAFVFGFFVFGTISKRNLNKVFKSRYGDGYTVDATIKQDDEVEAPDDDEDDDEDDDDDDDDDDE
uniref:Transmembrane protein n=1 Tax=Entomoneis paludosa TaxID=265537 RepID=A0A7S3DWX5_9STRA